MSLQHRTLWLLPALLAAAPLHAQIVRGRVLDARSGEPVPQASVTALTLENRNGGRTRTAADGTFTLELRAAGTFRLRGEREGYQASTSQPVPVAVRESVTVELRVSPQPLQIDPLRVTARVQPPKDPVLERNGFYDREAGGFGKFVRREDMDLHPEFNLAHTLARVPGVELDRDARGREIVTFTRGRMVGTLSRAQQGRRDNCFPLIYLDGSLMRYTADVQLNDIISPDQVGAIEVYRSAAEIPPQFNGINAACGVIVIWTRHDLQ
ncbi:MAG TPA: TonB-dependent receptor [Longimicrobiaceae bacterium]|nr:TonB-dependent receptor [Longimicrobiaceae bacterium]